MSPTEVIRSSNISSGFTIFNLHLFLKEVISNFSLLNSIQLLFFAISYHWLLHICHLHLLHFLPRSRNTANLSSLLLSLIVRPQLPAYSLWPFRLQPFNMAIPDHNNTDSTHHYEESIDQWICSQCFKTVSPTRPPVFNPENCSCVEAGGGGPVSQPRTEEQPLYGYDNTMNQPSYASSVVSFTGPEGPERENPNMQITNNYLPLGPDTGLNETQHRRSASFESDMSYQMRRFLVEEGYVNEEHRFLQQDVKIGYGGTSKKVNKGSKPSSGDSGRGSEEVGWKSWGAGDLTVNVGAWMEDFGGGYGDVGRGEGEYPLVMSGVTECDGGN